MDAGELYQEHRSFVHSMLRRYGVPPEEAADLCQEVFLVAHRKGGFEARSGRATTWLAAITIHIVMRHRRKQARGRARETFNPLVIDEAQGQHSPGETVAAREALKRVTRALRKLPGTKRAVFILFEFEGRSCAEIAELLCIPVGTVYSRLHAARAEFEANHGSAATDIPLALSASISGLSLGV